MGLTLPDLNKAAYTVTMDDTLVARIKELVTAVIAGISATQSDVDVTAELIEGEEVAVLRICSHYGGMLSIDIEAFPLYHDSAINYHTRVQLGRSLSKKTYYCGFVDATDKTLSLIRV